jgi:hypothetical protein
MSLGLGPKLWSGRIFGVTVRVHPWPLCGATYIGTNSLRSLRWRLWLAVLAGPPLAIAAMHFQDADFVSARDVSRSALEYQPANPWLTIMLTASQINLGEYEAARATLERIGDLPLTEAPVAPRSPKSVRRAISKRPLNVSVHAQLSLDACPGVGSNQSTE